ncbi:MAG: DNA polymerase III subunit gamma/tau [Mariprofundus sp.]|nr:DNA polymerase III subunit gamma/tau [Mariprofundus sp.]
MSYLVLARRWRPQKFADLVGQDIVVRTLKNALASGKLAHAYLLCGIRGVGKTTIARLMAMAVNCEHPDHGEPCGECASCRSVADGANLDVQEMDAASHTGVDDVREILDGVRYPPATLKTKVYIIDEAHMLSKSAFNALLKTLEEPPAHVMFILATTEADKLPVTVRSRCQRFDLRRLGQSEIVSYLNHVFDAESIKADADAIAAIAQAADGSVRDGLSLAERVLAYSSGHLTVTEVMSALAMVGYALARSLSEAVFAADSACAVQCLRDAVSRGHGPRCLLEELSRLWHQLACLQVDPELLGDEMDANHRVWLAQQATRLDSKALDLRYQVLLNGIRDLALVDERMGAEMVLMRLCGLNVISAVTAAVSGADDESQSKSVSPPFKDIKDAEAVDSQQGCSQKDDAEPVSSKEDAVVESVDHLPLSKTSEPAGHTFTTWKQAVEAFGEVKPGVSAMLDHVICSEFQDRVRLALDKHQQRAITASDRMAFAEWLGREVLWESLAEHEGESLSQERTRQARNEEARLRKGAEDDPHVQALMQEMDARLVKVLPAGVPDHE